MASRLFCPDAESCPVYNFWKEKKGETNRIVIKVTTEIPFHFYCLALTAVQDPVTKGGLPTAGTKLEKMLPRNGLYYDCKNIQMLNWALKTVSTFPKR